jgi:hypothetical protein
VLSDKVANKQFHFAADSDVSRNILVKVKEIASFEFRPTLSPLQ